MNPRSTFAVTPMALAAIFAICTASAQAPAPAAPAKAAAPPASPATGAPASTPTAAPPRLDMKPPARASRTTIVDADARNCLEFPSNYEIIKCAEKYLHRRAG
jgi:hypothetical protein